MQEFSRRVKHISLTALLAALATGCGGGGDGGGSGAGLGIVGSSGSSLPRLSGATPAVLSGTCAELTAKISFEKTTITDAKTVDAGTLTVAGTPVPAHCQVTGSMFQRTSPVDGKSYAIKFEMRLPLNWNGRFFYQANGGIDGSVVTATGGIGGGGPLTNALQQGFAVISSDAGHVASQGPTFGIDPQARLDYGYQAVGKLTPMAKKIIETAYGKGPDRSYIAGCSNGGRHTMVAASRYADQYDGFLVGNPGFRLPLAAIANIAGAQAYAALATNRGTSPPASLKPRGGSCPMPSSRGATRSMAPSMDSSRTPRRANRHSTWLATCRPVVAGEMVPASVRRKRRPLRSFSAARQPAPERASTRAFLMTPDSPRRGGRLGSSRIPCNSIPARWA